VNVALSSPLLFVLEAFADAWGFPAAATLTVLNDDGSQAPVAASALTTGSQVLPSMHKDKLKPAELNSPCMDG